LSIEPPSGGFFVGYPVGSCLFLVTIEYHGEKFAGYNKPKRTPNHPTKSHAVLVKEDGKVKLIRFGQQGVSGSPPRKGESDADKARRRSFKARHAKNIAKGKMSAAYWSSVTKWLVIGAILGGIGVNW
jgi:hypothetical protein